MALFARSIETTPFFARGKPGLTRFLALKRHVRHSVTPETQPTGAISFTRCFKLPAGAEHRDRQSRHDDDDAQQRQAAQGLMEDQGGGGEAEYRHQQGKRRDLPRGMTAEQKAPQAEADHGRAIGEKGRPAPDRQRRMQRRRDDRGMVFQRQRQQQQGRRREQARPDDEGERVGAAGADREQVAAAPERRRAQQRQERRQRRRGPAGGADDRDAGQRHQRADDLRAPHLLAQQEMGQDQGEQGLDLDHQRSDSRRHAEGDREEQQAELADADAQAVAGEIEQLHFRPAARTGRAGNAARKKRSAVRNSGGVGDAGLDRDEADAPDEGDQHRQGQVARRRLPELLPACEIIR